MWNNDCAFEAKEENWLPRFKKNFNIDKLVDVDGVPYEDDHDRPDQPDMCEIVRTLLAYKKF